mgnify:CR=1 FL=1
MLSSRGPAGPREGVPGEARAIAFKKGISVVLISQPRMLMAYGFLAKVFEVFAANDGVSGIELLRENTRIIRRGNFAWAVYEWRFAAMMGRERVAALGHTTLILEKRRGRWVIVHNHTSALVPWRPPEKPPAPPSP